MRLAHSYAGLIVAILAALAVGSVPASGEQSSPCGQGTTQGSAIRVVIPADTLLPAQRPTTVCFELSIRELAPLRETLNRGPVAVSVFDQEGRQLLSGGTLIGIANIIVEDKIRMRASFPD